MAARRPPLWLQGGKGSSAKRWARASLPLCLLVLLGLCRRAAVTTGRDQAAVPLPASGRRPPAPGSPKASGRRTAAAARAAAPVAAAAPEVASASEVGLGRAWELQPQPELGLGRGSWTLERDGFELIPLSLSLEDGGGLDAAQAALKAGSEMTLLAGRWRAIKNGDGSVARRQSYLRMRKHRAPLSLNAAAVLEAAERAVQARLGPDFVLNDVVAIADFDPKLPRQELHRDICRDAVGFSTHGVLAPLSHGARLHIVPGSHQPRGALRGSFASGEVLTVHLRPGELLLWDGMLVHAGDGGLEDFQPDVPNRLRLHAYAEREGEDRPYDHQGDRSIEETE